MRFSDYTSVFRGNLSLRHLQVCLEAKQHTNSVGVHLDVLVVVHEVVNPFEGVFLGEIEAKKERVFSPEELRGVRSEEASGSTPNLELHIIIVARFSSVGAQSRDDCSTPIFIICVTQSRSGEDYGASKNKESY